MTPVSARPESARTESACPETARPTVIAYRKACPSTGIGLSHYVLATKTSPLHKDAQTK
jgi:modified peptide precursor CbpA